MKPEHFKITSSYQCFCMAVMFRQRNCSLVIPRLEELQYSLILMLHCILLILQD